MTSQHKSAALTVGVDMPDWMQLLHTDIASTGSIAETARRVGVTRSALSGLINQTPSSPYVNGKASTETVAAKVRATIGLFECPFLSQEYGEAKTLSGLECQSYANIQAPPTHSPRAMQHWRACQGCHRKPNAALRSPVAAKPIEVMHLKDCQQAGIIDKVTLPLPEVGAPQIQEAA